jgi:hypothetical protein
MLRKSAEEARNQLPDLLQAAEGPLNSAFDDLSKQALLLRDSAPIIYFLEGHRNLAPRFGALLARAPAASHFLIGRDRGGGAE